MLNQIGSSICSRRYRFSDETMLQNGIAKVLAEDGIAFEREYPLGRDRVDFFVQGIALEVKVDGSLSEVTRQLHRYAQHPDVQIVALVTTKSQHCRMPSEMAGKPVRVIHLEGAF